MTPPRPAHLTPEDRLALHRRGFGRGAPQCGLADRGIRVYAALPGPFWTPAIATSDEETVRNVGSFTMLGRVGQSEEIAPAYVFLAPDASFVTGASSRQAAASGRSTEEREDSPMTSSAGPDGTYPPLDSLKPVAEGVWIVDSGPLRVFGMTLPVRMTVVRLGNGDLWLHSPTRYTQELRGQLDQHGTIRHLIAPDVAHWSFLQDWQRTCPDALTWAAPGLRERRAVRKAGVRIDQVLTSEAPPAWAGEIRQLTVPGLGFSEVDFFHDPSRTLMMTDLVQNLETDRLPTLTRIMARLNGVAAPAGRAPVYLRLAVRMKRREAAAAADQLIRWRPERVIFSHGRWFERDGTETLRRSLDWLVAA